MRRRALTREHYLNLQKAMNRIGVSKYYSLMDCQVLTGYSSSVIQANVTSVKRNVYSGRSLLEFVKAKIEGVLPKQLRTPPQEQSLFDSIEPNQAKDKPAVEKKQTFRVNTGKKIEKEQEKPIVRNIEELEPLPFKVPGSDSYEMSEYRNDFVYVKHNEVLTDTDIIAKQLEIQKKKLVEQIVKYKEDLIVFGKLEKLAEGKKGTASYREWYELNEHQTLLVIMRCRNSQVASRIQVAFVKAFMAMGKKLNELKYQTASQPLPPPPSYQQEPTIPIPQSVVIKLIEALERR